MELKSAAKRTLGTVGLALLAVALSSLLKHEFGAPNYGLGIVIGITLICYLFGLVAATSGFVLALLGVYLWGIEVGDPSTLPRLLAIVMTNAVTCSLVVLLQRARRSVAAHNNELRETQQQLAQALSYERNISGTLQRAFLPRVPEHFGTVSIAAMYEAGSEEAQIGGDFYDVLRLNDNELLIAIGDVSGKGIEAARQAAGAKYGLRSCIIEHRTPAEALQRLNAILHLDPEFSGFVTLFVGVMNAADGQLIYSNGGHEPPILYRKITGECLELKADGIIVGAFAGSEYAEATIELRQGDALLLFTDGLSEARNNSRMLGSGGLADILVSATCKSTGDYLNHVTGAARDFGGGQFRDDAAAVLLSID